MSMYPFNPNKVGEQQQTDAGVLIDRCHLAHYRVAAALAAVADHYVASVNMANGAYTLANTSPGDGTARNVTVTQTAVGAEDTNGKIVVTGTNLAGDVISEELVPNAGATVAGTHAFATIISIVGEDWVIAEGNDTITVGFGDVVGLPDCLPHNTVLMAFENDALEAVAPTVTVDSATLDLNTVDLATALGGNPVDVYYLV